MPVMSTKRAPARQLSSRAIALLINNAGGNQPGATLDYLEDEYRAIFEQNLFSAFEMCRLAHP